MRKTLRNVLLASALALTGCKAVRDNIDANFGPGSADWGNPQHQRAVQNFWTGILLKSYGIQKNQPAAYVAGDAAQQYAMSQANQPQSQEHLSVAYVGTRPMTPFDNPDLLQISTCRWIDFNQNNQIDLDELISASRLYSDDRNYITVKNYNPVNLNVSLKIFGQSGNLVTTNRDCDSFISAGQFNQPSWKAYNLNDLTLTPGADYYIQPYVNGTQFGKAISFEIIGSGESN